MHVLKSCLQRAETTVQAGSAQGRYRSLRNRELFSFGRRIRVSGVGVRSKIDCRSFCSKDMGVLKRSALSRLALWGCRIQIFGGWWVSCRGSSLAMQHEFQEWCNVYEVVVGFRKMTRLPRPQPLSNRSNILSLAGGYLLRTPVLAGCGAYQDH